MTKHGPQAPKGLDEEDILFLNEHSIKQAQKRRDIVEAEESELAIFRNAQRQKSNNGAITRLNSNNNNNNNIKSEANFKNANINDTNSLKRKSKLPSNLLKKRQKKIRTERTIQRRCYVKFECEFEVTCDKVRLASMT